ncbi:MAG TPA: hypothetical protein VFU54_13690, partial [Actinomycetota bacterium]|nr:hypothetical protein [Actinomycetota bacterium]
RREQGIEALPSLALAFPHMASSYRSVSENRGLCPIHVRHPRDRLTHRPLAGQRRWPPGPDAPGVGELDGVTVPGGVSEAG